MPNTIDIPLDPATSLGLRRREMRLGLIAAAAMHTPRPQAPSAEPAPSEPMTEAPAVARADDPPPETTAIDIAAPPAEPAGLATVSVREPQTSPVRLTVPAAAAHAATAAEVSPGPERGGDVYIAHYYARLPGDASRNPFTRRGGG